MLDESRWDTVIYSWALRYFTIVGLDLRLRIVSTITKPGSLPEGRVVGAVIMLGTLFGLIVVIFGLVIYIDPEARRGGRSR